MNLLQALYCNQYHELKPKGKAYAGRANGTGLVTVALLLNTFELLFLIAIIYPPFADGVGDLIIDIFGRRNGRGVGKILALIPFLIIFPIVKYTLGRDDNYNRLIERFEALRPEEQERVSKKGLYYFFVSLGLLVIPLLYVFIAD